MRFISSIVYFLKNKWMDRQSLLRLVLLRHQHQRQRRSLWVRPVLLRREQCGEFHTLVHGAGSSDTTTQQGTDEISAWASRSLSRCCWRLDPSSRSSKHISETRPPQLSDWLQPSGEALFHPWLKYFNRDFLLYYWIIPPINNQGETTWNIETSRMKCKRSSIYNQ